MNSSMDIISFFIDLIKIILGIEPNEGLVRSFFTQASYPIALIVVAIVSIIILYVVINLLVNFIKTIQDNKIDKRKILFVVTALSIILAGFTVNGITAANTEKPVFIDKNGEAINVLKHDKLIFIGESPNFSWKFDEDRSIEKRLRNEGKELKYKISYQYFKTHENNSFITETKAVDLHSAIIPGDLRWQVIPGYMNNNKFVVLNKYNNSNFLETSYYPNLYEKIRDKKVFTILNTGMPKRGYFGFISFSKPMGFDYSLAEKIKQEIFRNSPDIYVDYEPENWSKLLSIMGKGKVADIAINTISKTKDREEEYQIKFSDPYLENITLSLIVYDDPKVTVDGSSTVDILEVLRGKQVGVMINSTSEKTLKEFNKILRSSPRYKQNNNESSEIGILAKETSENVIIDLYKQKTNYALIDTPYVEAIENNLEYKIKTFRELTSDLYPPEFPSEMIGENYSIVVNSDHRDFLNRINIAIKRLKDREAITRLQEYSRNKYLQTLTAESDCLARSDTENIPSHRLESCSI